MEAVILAQVTDEKGKPYVIEMNPQWDPVAKAREFLDESFDGETPDENGNYDEEYAMANCLHAGRREYDKGTVSKEDRNEDREALREALGSLENTEKLNALLDRLPRKKNGTFAIGRRIDLWAGQSFCHYWEDSYKWAGPILYLKTVSDHRAELLFETGGTVEKY